jgi:peptidyl-prolyl isomerase E (cyclophilin E)
VTYGAAGDAQDAIDNMDLNELKGRVVKVNLAKPMKGLLSAPVQNRASALMFGTRLLRQILILYSLLVWESEEWLQEHVKPLAESGGKPTPFLLPEIQTHMGHIHRRSGTAFRTRRFRLA